jgi:hypothetical protein
LYCVERRKCVVGFGPFTKKGLSRFKKVDKRKENEEKQLIIIFGWSFSKVLSKSVGGEEKN